MNLQGRSEKRQLKNMVANGQKQINSLQQELDFATLISNAMLKFNQELDVLFLDTHILVEEFIANFELLPPEVQAQISCRLELTAERLHNIQRKTNTQLIALVRETPDKEF